MATPGNTFLLLKLTATNVWQLAIISLENPYGCFPGKKMGESSILPKGELETETLQSRRLPPESRKEQDTCSFCPGSCPFQWPLVSNEEFTFLGPQVWEPINSWVPGSSILSCSTSTIAERTHTWRETWVQIWILSPFFLIRSEVSQFPHKVAQSLPLPCRIKRIQDMRSILHSMGTEQAHLCQVYDQPLCPKRHSLSCSSWVPFKVRGVKGNRGLKLHTNLCALVLQGKASLL